MSKAPESPVSLRATQIARQGSHLVYGLPKLDGVGWVPHRDMAKLPSLPAFILVDIVEWGELCGVQDRELLERRVSAFEL
jgi:hypothetical protein